MSYTRILVKGIPKEEHRYRALQARGLTNLDIIPILP